MNRPNKYVCPKCGGRICTTGQMETSGGLLPKFSDFKRRRFTSVTCNECKYTEFYNVPLKKLGDVLDYITTG